MSFRQMLPFLFLNVVISVVVVLSILFWWDGRNEAGGEPAAGAVATAGIAPGDLATPNLAAPPSGTVAPELTEPAGADEPVIHVVQPGETLNLIGARYGVSVEEILQANGLDNPDFISAGQQLTIYVGGIPDPTIAPTEAAVAQPSPIPTEPAATGGGVIGVPAVIDPGNLASEAVQIVNSGVQQQSIQGWKVRDEDNNVYTFGNVSIFGEGAGILLHTRAGDNTFSDLYWGLAEPAWRAGETLTLWDANEQVVATFVVP